jgi:ATP-dependent DNA helicase RecG
MQTSMSVHPAMDVTRLPPSLADEFVPQLLPNGDPRSIEAGKGLPTMIAEMAQAELYPPQYRQNTDAAIESVTVTLFNLKRPSAWDEVSDWIDREGAIANADVVRIARVDTLKASKMLIGWREQGLLVALPVRAKRNMAYTKPSAADQPVSLLSPLEDNNGVVS